MAKGVLTAADEKLFANLKKSISAVKKEMGKEKDPAKRTEMNHKLKAAIGFPFFRVAK